MSDDGRGPGPSGRGSNPLDEFVGRLLENLTDLGGLGDDLDDDDRDDRRDGPGRGGPFGGLDGLGGFGGLGGLFGEPDGPRPGGGPSGAHRSGPDPGGPRRGGASTVGTRPPAPTPRLDRFGHDLTAAARADRLDPVIGRDREVAQVLEVLSRRTKNNPVLVGDPGVGKTAIVEGIAARVAEGRVPASLAGRRVVALDLAGMVAGTKYRGEFEKRLRGVIDEVTAADRMVVLFLDELHTLVGAGSSTEGTMDAADILKPALARGDLQVVGATTLDEYRRHVESDAALERRFAPILVDEPTVEQTVAILDGLADRYAGHHRVRIPADARRAAVELSARYVHDRFLPDKAIDLMDTASARVRLRHADPEHLERERAAAVAAEDYERAETLTREIDDAGRDRPRVTVADVAEVVAASTGVPAAHLTDSDRDRLLHLADTLRRRVVGQDHALDAVADAVLAGRAGMAHRGRPVGSFLFTGPTGVGKTELARALAEALFGSDERIVRFDMSEFREPAAVARLTGAPPGYVGHDRPGELTDALRRTPYCVVLLDEIDKAHPDVLATLLQVLDAGRLTDSKGRTASFADAVVIMTSNLGAAELRPGRDPEEARAAVTAALSLRLRPEFLGRVDETVLFARLDRPSLRRIVELLLAGTHERLGDQRITMTVTPDAVDALVERGHDPELGARPLRRVVTREVDRALSRRIVAGALRPGRHVTVDADDGRLTFEVGAGPA